MALDDIPAVLGTQNVQQKQKKPSYAELEQFAVELQQELEFARQDVDYLKQVATVDPWKQNPPQTNRERFADRVLGQRMNKEDAPEGHPLWLIQGSLIELLALLNITKKEYNKFVRDWSDIEALAQGGGNKQIVSRKLEKMLYGLQLMRSRGDNKLEGYTTLTALITDRSEVDQMVRMPSTKEPMGFFDQLKRKK